jgi:uncharacterized protein (DUF2336 family)
MVADEATRIRLGASATTSPAILTQLAVDPSVKVRATLALNAAAPPEARRALARDSDERVRVLLARKLAALVPSLPDVEKNRLREQAFQTLSDLVADEAMRVRAAVAEEVKRLPDAPRELILRLAADPAIMVCEPVILFSPLLTTADLVALVTAAPSAGTVNAVARRPQIAAAVSDAIANTADSEAIRALLCNKSAQIREATLDSLVDRARSEVTWHEPLVHRPMLSAKAVQVLSNIVASHLVEVLANRTDLDPAITRDLRQKLTDRLQIAGKAAPAPDNPANEAMGKAHSLADSGSLSEAEILGAIAKSELPLVTAMLAVAAAVPVAVVERAIALRSTKGIVSLTWKAGFSMRTAMALQPLLGRVPPDAVLRAGPGGTYPLAPDEMRWQIDFLGRSGR